MYNNLTTLVQFVPAVPLANLRHVGRACTVIGLTGDELRPKHSSYLVSKVREESLSLLSINQPGIATTNSLTFGKLEKQLTYLLQDSE